MFVFASRVDTLGLVNVEAMLSGIPVAVPTDACIAEFVTHGVSAECYELGAAGLAAAIGRVLDDPLRAKRMAAEGRKAMIYRWEGASASHLWPLFRRNSSDRDAGAPRPARVAARRLPAHRRRVRGRGGDAREVGVRAADLTVFVIPHHEGATTIDAHAPTVDFLRGLADSGACLAMHGLTHRMPGRAFSPAGIIRAHVFARGQGELYKSDAADAQRRLDEGAAVLRRAGLDDATRAFVPPAWQLSPAARQVVERAGFEFYEVFGGIVPCAGRQPRGPARPAPDRLGLAQRRRGGRDRDLGERAEPAPARRHAPRRPPGRHAPPRSDARHPPRPRTDAAAHARDELPHVSCGAGLTRTRPPLTLCASVAARKARPHPGPLPQAGEGVN